MKSNELMVGNLIDTGRGIAVIHSFVYDEVRVYLSLTVEKSRIFGFLISEIKPVPLTRKLLISFGFVNHGLDANIYLLFSDIIIKGTDRHLVKCRIQYNNGHWIYVFNPENYSGYECIEIKYVHQLQNVYFVLRDEIYTF